MFQYCIAALFAGPGCRTDPSCSNNSKRAAATTWATWSYIARREHAQYTRYCTSTTSKHAQPTLIHDGKRQGLTRTTFTERGASLSRCEYAGGRTGATKTSALLVPVLWAGRGFSRIPRTFLPPNPTREGTTSDRPRELGAEQHSSTAAYDLDSLHVLVHGLAGLRVCCGLASKADTPCSVLRSPTTTTYRRRIAILMRTK
jgi:hypothetical protein